MVFFKRPPGADGTPDPALPQRAATPTSVPEPVSPELRTDSGAAYLRLLAQLANCGIDATAPTLLRASSTAR